MKFVWDETKRRTNFQKHGIDFINVPAVFFGPMAVRLDKREAYGEDRFIGIGLLGNLIVVVVYTEPDETTSRIISARKAIKYE
jgi:uncharacterized DUF497 family protein